MKDKKALPLRIAPELYEELKAWAEQDLRSVNGQIESILRSAVEIRKGQRAKADKENRRDTA
jgi:hypothetical protein